MKIQVCTWKSCKSRFSEYILKRVNSDIEKFHLENISVENCPCLGQCKEWPNVIVDGKIENYCDPIKVSKIMFEKLKQRNNSKKTTKETSKEEPKNNI